MYQFDKRINEEITKTNQQLSKRKRTNRSKALAYVDAIRQEYLLHHSYNRIVDIKVSVSYRYSGQLITWGWKPDAVMYLRTNTLANIYKFCELEAKSVEDVKKYKYPNSIVNAYSTLFHEMYHARNKIQPSDLEEAITELNAKLAFHQHFSNIAGFNTSDLKFTNLSYSKQINELLFLMKKLGFQEKRMFDVIYDIKNFDLNKSKVKAKWLDKVDSYTKFVFFLDKFYKKGLAEKIFGTEIVNSYDYFNLSSQNEIYKYMKEEKHEVESVPHILKTLDFPKYKNKSYFYKHLDKNPKDENPSMYPKTPKEELLEVISKYVRH